MVQKRIVVTGGAGFIGSHIVEKLCKEGHEVILVDNFFGGDSILNEMEGDFKIVHGDLTNPRTCHSVTKDVDTVYHLAAHAAEGQSVFIPNFNLQANLVGSVQMLTSAINNGVKNFVFTSSIAAYGKPHYLPIKEDHPLEPEDPYAVTKMAFENYLRVYHELGQINPFVVRFFNVYGERQRLHDPYRGVVPIFINKCLRNESPLIFGDGLQKRAFTYVSDVVDPICEVTKHKELINSPVNIGDVTPYTVKELAEKIKDKVNPNVEIKYLPKRTSDVYETFCDISKAERIMGYKPKVDLNTGLDRNIEWAKKQGKQQFRYMSVNCIPKLSPEVYTKKQM